MFRYQNILVPLDGSELAERALVPALALAAVMPAKLYLIRVAIPLSLNLDPKLYQSILKMRQDDAQHYHKHLLSLPTSAYQVQTDLLSNRYPPERQTRRCADRGFREHKKRRRSIVRRTG